MEKRTVIDEAIALLSNSFVEKPSQKAEKKLEKLRVLNLKVLDLEARTPIVSPATLKHALEVYYMLLEHEKKVSPNCQKPDYSLELKQIKTQLKSLKTKGIITEEAMRDLLNSLVAAITANPEVLAWGLYDYFLKSNAKIPGFAKKGRPKNKALDILIVSLVNGFKIENPGKRIPWGDIEIIVREINPDSINDSVSLKSRYHSYLKKNPTEFLEALKSVQVNYLSLQ